MINHIPARPMSKFSAFMPLFGTGFAALGMLIVVSSAAVVMMM